ncbi:uncharacterized protein VNE69_07128 [Vairimorpha necatrix]|uniref:Membrane protein n=1 Tax=Vairimorpha necatrix TaxID=6039 RepID=A0AAX4JDL4_9MICR
MIFLPLILDSISTTESEKDNKNVNKITLDSHSNIVTINPLEVHFTEHFQEKKAKQLRFKVEKVSEEILNNSSQEKLMSPVFNITNNSVDSKINFSHTDENIMEEIDMYEAYISSSFNDSNSNKECNYLEGYDEYEATECRKIGYNFKREKMRRVEGSY